MGGPFAHRVTQQTLEYSLAKKAGKKEPGVKGQADLILVLLLMGSGILGKSHNLSASVLRVKNNPTEPQGSC